MNCFKIFKGGDAEKGYFTSSIKYRTIYFNLYIHFESLIILQTLTKYIFIMYYTDTFYPYIFLSTYQIQSHRWEVAYTLDSLPVYYTHTYNEFKTQHASMSVDC